MAPAPLKNGLSQPAISRLAHNMARAWPAFDKAAFITSAMRGLSRLELKERVAHVAETLASFLPTKYPEALRIIVAAAQTWDRGDSGDPLRGFAAWPLFHFIEHRGADDFKRSMAALRSITHLFSAEFAIRTFIARYPERAFDELTRWTHDESEQVRRLVSEATRSRLPWATRIQPLVDDPARVWSLLGFTNDPQVALSAIRVEPACLDFDGELSFAVTVESTARKAQRLVVDYAMHFVKANGKTRPKVFKLKVLELAGGEVAELSRRYSFRPISTRKYHAGTHAIVILVNGQARARAEFELRAPA